MSEKLDKMKDKISKLLAKAERTDNEYERESFTTSAHKLMLRYGIEMAELESAGEVKPEEIVEVYRLLKGGYTVVLVSEIYQLARAFGHLSGFVQGSGSTRALTIVGHKSDVEAFWILADSIGIQAMAGLHRFQKANAPLRQFMTNHEKTIQSRSYLQGFYRIVSKRVAELRRTEEAAPTVSTGAALVLASKQDRVDDHMEANHNLKSSRGGAKSFSRSGAQAGAQAGMRADLGGKRFSGGRTAIQ